MMSYHEGKQSDRTLSMLINPLCSKSFLDDYWMKRPLHMDRADSEYNSGLFTWSALNTILELHNPLPPRLTLSHKGRQIAASQYIRQTSGWRKTLIDVTSVESLLSAGATLIVNGIDELHRPLREALEDLESTLRFPIHANLYAAWAIDEAFPMHWDEQETFIVQVAGRKHWTVHAPTAIAPNRSMMPPPPPPHGSPDLDVQLQAGQRLYLPKGWWHRVVPMAEPTLHLTITCEAPTGVDLLKWAINRLAGSESARLPIPQEQSEDYLKLLQRGVVEELSQPDVILAFWQQSASATKPRLPFRLPLFTATK